MSTAGRAAVILIIIACVGCPTATPPRGVILISLDTLRADHLGAYGYSRDTSPFFDQLASRHTLFERAIVQYPSTLTSHMSMLTGLYPQEHGVYPPATVLADSVQTLAEVFQRAGIRTGGFTEGGLVAGRYGFSRGFDVFADPQYREVGDVERSFARGLEFLRGLGSEERFFLFLHTYAIHDPYAPPAAYAGLFGDQSPPPDDDSGGQRLLRFNRGAEEISPGTVRHFEAQYDATIRYVDDVLARFFSELEELGLTDSTVVVITSDHGEEFLEHGKLAHTQVYPECVHVPLLIVEPRNRRERRVAEVVESVDLAPTLLEIMRLPAWSQPSGRSLVALMRGDREGESRAISEKGGPEKVRSLIAGGPSGSYQLLLSEAPHEKAGTWISDVVSFDVGTGVERLHVRTYELPRIVEIAVDGRSTGSFAVGPRWQWLPLPGSESQQSRRVTVRVDGCDSPRELGRGDGRRCLGLLIGGEALRRSELYDLGRDPLAQSEILADDLGRKQRMQAILESLQWRARSRGVEVDLSTAEEEQLKALGYIDGS